MEKQYTYWQDGQFFVGFLDDYPDDSTQGLSLTQLEEALIEIYEIKQEEKKHDINEYTAKDIIKKLSK